MPLVLVEFADCFYLGTGQVMEWGSGVVDEGKRVGIGIGIGIGFGIGIGIGIGVGIGWEGRWSDRLDIVVGCKINLQGVESNDEGRDFLVKEA